MQHSSPLAPLPDAPQARRRLLCWVMLLLFVALLCVICSTLGVFVLRSLPSLLPTITIDTPAPYPPEPTYQPITPPIFGLSGQATCRNTKPPTDSPWLPVAIADAQHDQLDILTFLWQIWQESKYNPTAVSSAHAIGIAQFLPSTAENLGIDPYDPAQSLEAAARLDSQALQQYASRALQLSGHYGGASTASPRRLTRLRRG